MRVFEKKWFAPLRRLVFVIPHFTGSAFATAVSPPSPMWRMLKYALLLSHALVLLASPDHLSHGSSSAPSWEVRLLPASGCRCRHTSTLGCLAGRSTQDPSGGGTAGFVGSRGLGGQRRRQKIGWSSTRVFRRRSPQPEACSEPRPPSSVAAVVLELQPRDADTNKLAVYGELHRLLGTTRCRQLLGLEAVATLTSLNYLILHNRDGGPSLYAHDEDPGSGCGGARLALGDRSWDICGIGQGVSFRPCLYGRKQQLWSFSCRST